MSKFGSLNLFSSDKSVVIADNNVIPTYDGRNLINVKPVTQRIDFKVGTNTDNCTWTSAFSCVITHNLNCLPVIVFYDNENNMLLPDVKISSATTFSVNFSSSVQQGDEFYCIISYGTEYGSQQEIIGQLATYVQQAANASNEAQQAASSSAQSATSANNSANSASASATSAQDSAESAAESSEQANAFIVLDPCTGMRVEYTSLANSFNWSDPDDKVIGNVTIAFDETVLVRKEDSYPQTKDDGTIVARATVRNQYAGTVFVDDTIESGKTYRYALFSKTNTGAWNALAQNRYPYAGEAHLGAITSKAIVYGVNSVKLSWKEPNDVTDSGYVLNKWKRTLIIEKAGSVPSSASDGRIVAVTSRDPEHDEHTYPSGVVPQEKYYYFYHPLEISGLEEGTTYYYKAFSEDSNDVMLSLEGNEFPYYSSMTPELLAYYTRMGMAQEFVSLGMLLDLEHPEYPGEYMEVVGFDTQVPWDESKTHTLDLMMKYVIFENVFHTQENQWGLNIDCARWEHDAFFKNNHTYGVLDGGAYVQLTAGTHFNYGDTTATYNDTVYQMNEVYIKHPDGNRYQHNPEFALPTTWANSNLPANQWFVKQEPFDNSTASWNSKNGLMYNMPSSWADAIIEIKKKHYVCTTWRSFMNWSDNQEYRTKWFLPTLKDIYNTNNANIAEGIKQFDIFTGTGNSAKIRNKLLVGSVSCAWWLGSPINILSIDSCYVSSAGASSSYSVSNACGVLLACCLG